MIDFSSLLNEVPECKEYLKVDELNTNSNKLAEENPDIVKILELGKSTCNEPIKCLKIGKGKYNALIYGFPNPEEPVGGLMLDHFSNLLANNRSMLEQLDYTWYLIKCIDPDGARLNEGFLKGPFNPLHFSKNYYRTPGSFTGEMNFPYKYGELNIGNPTSETKALMKLIDQTRFDFISSLHNMKFDGMTYQVSEPCPNLYPSLWQIAKEYNIMLRKRPGRMLAPGVQLNASLPDVLAGYFTPIQNYIRSKAAGKGPLREPRGAFVFEYTLLTNPDVFMMIPECCIWYDPRLFDDGPSKKTLNEVLDYTQNVGSETNKFLFSLYEKSLPLLKDSSPFLEMLRQLFGRERERSINYGDPSVEFNQKQLKSLTTLATEIATEGRADIYRMFNLGAMIRMFDYQLSQHNNKKTELESYRNEANEKLEEWNNIVEKKYERKTVPLKNLICMNMGSILYSAEYVKWKRIWDRSYETFG